MGGIGRVNLEHSIHEVSPFYIRWVVKAVLIVVKYSRDRNVARATFTDFFSYFAKVVTVDN